ncbi:MAG: LytTR family DNA-binding domain-containing protein [Cyclobacteriaceae bacterium]
MIRAVIIDDEFLARQRILNLLKSYPDIKSIGEGSNGIQGVSLINTKEPDLVFLDIQMPDMDGFSVIKQIQTQNQPCIVFTTAFDSYAIKAFNVHALDYLLKPFDEVRFAESMNKVKTYFNTKQSAEFNDKLLGLIKEYQKPENSFLSSFDIKDRGNEIQIDADDIYHLEANGNYINLHTKGKIYLYRATMNFVSKKLDPTLFIRVHRSLILNKRYIERCHYLNNNEYEFLTKSGAKLISGRSFKDDIVRYLNE